MTVGQGDGGGKQAVCGSDTCHQALSLDNIGTDTQTYLMRRRVMDSMIWMIVTPADNSPIYRTTVEHDGGRATRLRSVPTSDRVNKSLLWARAQDQTHFPTKLHSSFSRDQEAAPSSLSVSSSPGHKLTAWILIFSATPSEIIDYLISRKTRLSSG